MFTSRRTHIANLYEEILGRPADTDGLNHYNESNLSIDEIKTILVNSEEFNLKFLKECRGTLLRVSESLDINSNVEFYASDSEENYKQQCKLLGTSWIYHNKPITYELNSLGYRMKEFDQIDWSNYMAVFGCSITTGVGLALEDTFSYKISQSLNLDLVNASMSGSGNDVVLMNLSRLLESNLPPKLIIINWSHIARKCYWNYSRFNLFGISIDKPGPWKKAYDCYVENLDQWRFEFLEIKRQVETLCKLAGVPIWQLTNFSGLEFAHDITKIVYQYPNTSDINYINENVARDYGTAFHPGIRLQDLIIEQWNNVKHSIGF